MHLQHFLAPLVAVSVGASPTTVGCSSLPSSAVEFSSDFHQPVPPLIKAEFNTSFIQHKWNQDLSHITTGYIINSPSTKSVLVNEAYEGGLASSHFNYANTTAEGLVDNTLTTFPVASSENVTIWRGYVNSNFPLFSEDFLVHSAAVYSGLVKRDLIPGVVASWKILYQGVIPVTVYVDACQVLVGYDYFSPGLRTRVVNLFFNTRVASSSNTTVFM